MLWDFQIAVSNRIHASGPSDSSSQIETEFMLWDRSKQKQNSCWDLQIAISNRIHASGPSDSSSQIETKFML
jgi:hypothetical protein